MSDLGDLVIKSRPLIIHEAIVGGRRLNKVLFMQMPELDYIPFGENGERILAWVEYHWKYCGEGCADYTSLYSGHRHVLVDTGRPSRATVWRPMPSMAPVGFGDLVSSAREAILAHLARWRLEQKNVNPPKFPLQLSHREHRIDLGYLTETSYDVLHSYITNWEEPPKALIALSKPALATDDLVRQIDAGMEREIAWREKCAALWRLVTEETPQVFL